MARPLWRRRDFLRLVPALVVSVGCSRQRRKPGGAPSAAARTPSGDAVVVEALLGTILPEELCRKEIGQVERCLSWVDESRWSAEYRRDLAAIDETAQRRFGRAFPACTLEERTALVSEILERASPQNTSLDVVAHTLYAPPGHWTEKHYPHVALALLVAVFSTAEAHNLAQGYRVDRWTCRGIDDLGRPPAKL